MDFDKTIILLHRDHGALKLMVSQLLYFVPLAQASDPSTYELIQKIHILQKRLISKTEEVVEKELLLQVAFSFSVLIEHAYFPSSTISRTVCFRIKLFGGVACPIFNCRWQQ